MIKQQDNNSALTAYAQLNDIADSIKTYKTESWNQFPNIDLYMDQVITYLERLLNIFEEPNDNPMITASMVNNYVKEGYLKRPVNKKYDRVHLATLYIMSMLKPVLPIPLIADALKGFKDENDYQKIFEEFGNLQNHAFQGVAERLDSVLQQKDNENFEDLLRLFALQLTSEANAFRITAEKILNTISKKEKSKK